MMVLVERLLLSLSSVIGWFFDTSIVSQIGRFLRVKSSWSDRSLFASFDSAVDKSFVRCW